MTEEIEQLLKNLGLKKILEILDTEVTRAQKHDSTYETFLARLLRAQYHRKQETALDWRIRRARLPNDWTLESFPYRRQKGVKKRQINAFASLDFVAKSENIVFVGPTGVGKTGLATGILLKALQNRTATAPSLSRPRTCSTKCMPRSPTDPRASSSITSRGSTCSASTKWATSRSDRSRRTFSSS